MSIGQEQDAKFIEPHLPSSEQAHNIKENFSPFKEEYLKEMNFQDHHLLRNSLLNQLKKYHIYEETMDQNKMVSFLKINPSKFCEIIQIDVKLGMLLQRIRIINIDGESPVHGCDSIGCGSFGKIYKYESGESIRAVKCFSLNEGQKLQHFLILAIAQYGFLKIASFIEVGPSINPYSFDIYVYKHEIRSKQDDNVSKKFCIEFQTQYCQSTASFTPESKEQLYQSLFCLHQLNITHCDIKPENIMYSLTHKKWIFIDFGVTTAVHQPIGQRTQTKYKGTLKYAGEEMKKLYSAMYASKQQHCEDYIDLYWNDVHGLKLTCKDIESRPFAIERDISTTKQSQIKILQQHFFIINFKYCIYFGNGILEQYYISNIIWNKQNRLNMVYFLFQLKYIPERFRMIFANFLHTREIEGMELTVLKNILAEMKSSLNYDEQQFNRYQLEIKSKHEFFKQIAESLQTARQQDYKRLAYLKAYEDKRIDNVLSYLQNYKRGSKQQQQLYHAVLFNAVNFAYKNHNFTIDNKIEVCKAYYQLDHADELKEQLDYIKYFIDTALNLCLSSKSSELNQFFIEIYMNYLLLGLANLNAIKKIYSNVLSISINLSKVCEYFLQIYSLNFWIDEQIFSTDNFDYLELKRYIISIMYKIYEKLQSNEDEQHKYCDKSQQICLQMETIMLKRIQHHALIANPNPHARQNQFQYKMRKCLQALKSLKISYFGTLSPDNGINEIPNNLKDFYIEEHYMLNPESWARVTFHIDKFIGCKAISYKWGFVIKKLSFYMLYCQGEEIKGFLAEFQTHMTQQHEKKNDQRMKTYFEIIIEETYSEEKTMYYLQKKRDTFISQSIKVFVEVGNLFVIDQLANLMVKLGQAQSRFIWYYLNAVNDSQRALAILRSFYQKIKNEKCLVKKQHKLLKLREFVISHQIKFPELGLNHQSILLNCRQQKQLLEIKIKYIEQKLLSLSNMDELKKQYLVRFYEMEKRNNRFIDFLLKNIHPYIYLDLINFLITSSKNQQAIDVILKISENLLYFLSKQTSILSKKVKTLLYDIFITKRCDNFKYWLAFRNQFVKRTLNQCNNVLIFYNLVVGLIDQIALELTTSFYDNKIPKLIVPNDFYFMNWMDVRRLVVQYTRLLAYQIPVFHLYELQNYYRLVRYCMLYEEKSRLIRSRYKKYVNELHFKAIHNTLSLDANALDPIKKQFLSQPDYHIIINIYRRVPNYNQFTELVAKQKLKQKIDCYIYPYKGIIIKKVKFPK